MTNSRKTSGKGRSDILAYLASGMTEQEIRADLPQLTGNDIRACLAFAAERERRLVSIPAN